MYGMPEEARQNGMMINQGITDKIKALFPADTLVRLVRMDDSQAPPIGTLGRVKFVDDIGTVHISWDNGSSLGVVYGVDEIEKIT